MPSWTLGDLMSQATARIGFRSDLAASVASFWVNAAYLEVAGTARHAELEKVTVFSVASGDSRAALPTDAWEVLGLSYLTNSDFRGSMRTFRRISTERADAAGYTPAGKPSEYVQYASWLELWPSPDSAYSLQLRYLSRPSDMTDVTAVPSLATEWRPAVLYLSEALLHEYVGNEMEGANARVRYQTYVQELRRDRGRRDANAPELRISMPKRRPRYGGTGLDDSWS